MKYYKLVAGPTTSQIVDKGGSSADAVKSFETIISDMASQGWAYHSMEPITTQQTKGCMFNRQTIVTTFYMLVFEKDA